jgi:hypothetical protein
MTIALRVDKTIAQHCIVPKQVNDITPDDNNLWRWEIASCQRGPCADEARSARYDAFTFCGA